MRPRPASRSAATTAVAAPARQRHRNEVVAVEAIAVDGEEGLARLDRAAVDGDAGDPVRPHAHRPTAHRGEEGIIGPQRARHAATSAASACLTASWSEKGMVRSPTIWPVSWPLPATQSTSPGSEHGDGARRSPRRGRRSRWHRARRRSPPCGSPPASSERGLSSVTMTTSALPPPPRPSAAACRDRGRRRRRRRRSAGPCVIGRSACERAHQRIGLVGVVDEDHGAVLLSADEFQPARARP